MRVRCTRVILVVQFAVGANEHRSALFLWPRVEPLHHLVLLAFAVVLLEKDWIIQKGATVHICRLSVLLAAHLNVVVLSDDDIAVHFLDDALLHR